MKPIPMKEWEVRALLANRKSVTRRVVKQCHVDKFVIAQDGKLLGSFDGYEPYPTVDDCPYQPATILYVQETWAAWSRTMGTAPSLYYKADGNAPDKIKWHPSIHMPREAARIFLRVTDVRVERLQDITEEQAVREGVYRSREDYGIAIYAFSDIWDSTIKKSDLPLYGWDADPYVWVIEFERISKEDIPLAELARWRKWTGRKLVYGDDQRRR